MIRFERTFARQRPVDVRVDLLEVDAGATCFVGTSADGVALALALAAGMASPSSGVVRHDGVAATAASVRIASLFVPMRPDLPDDLTVSQWLELAARVRGCGCSVERGIDMCGIQGLARARIGTLQPAERRAVALAEGLGCARVKVVVVHEPLALVEGQALSSLLARSGNDASRTWLFGAASASDAARLAPRAVRFARGRVTHAGACTESFGAFEYDGVVVRCEGARALARAIADDPRVTSLEVGSDTIVVRADDVRVAADVVGEAVVRCSADVLEVREARRVGGGKV